MGKKTEDLQPFGVGLSFVVYLPNITAVWDLIYKLEAELTLERGYSSVRAGPSGGAYPICSCEEADECNGREGCLFVSHHDDEVNHT